MNPLRADFKKFTLEFIQPMGTSRGILYERMIYILSLADSSNRERIGLGECAPLPGLSRDDRPDFSEKLNDVCEEINAGVHPAGINLIDWPSLRFGLESALLDLESGGKRLLFITDFTAGREAIPTNGLVVMADVETMLRQAYEKINLGFRCIKIKIGAHDFDAECELLSEIRKRYAPEEIELRLDANGAFEPQDALEKLRKLAEYHIHSLEQPIKPGQRRDMADISKKSPIPIALDEELIAIKSPVEKRRLLETVKPKYIILKPTLVGGLSAAVEWIDLARECGIGYWVTSALESNIGLNIISQWTSTLAPQIPQGLGTGQLYRANFTSPLTIADGKLHYLPHLAPQNSYGLSDLKLQNHL